MATGYVIYNNTTYNIILFRRLNITTKRLFSRLTAVLVYRPEDDDFDMEEELRKLHPQRPPRQRELEPRSRRGLVGDPRVGVIHEGRGPGDSEEESDSDGPILYRDDDDDDEDVPLSKFFFLGTFVTFMSVDCGRCFFTSCTLHDHSSNVCTYSCYSLDLYS